MNVTKAGLMTVPVLLVLSGCLTSEDPFYQESDIKVDDRLVGTYGETNRPQSSTHFDISQVDEFDEHKGHYYIMVHDNPSCSMKFGAVLFQVGTNRFLDMVPIVKACDHLAESPPSLIELLQSATLQPMHMVVKVDMTTKGIRFGFADHPALLKAAKSHPEYFRSLKPGQIPRLVADTSRQREFLLKFGGDTNIFQPGQFTRPVNDLVDPRTQKERP